MARVNEDWKVQAEGALASELKTHLGLSVRQAKGLLDGGCVKVNGEVVVKHGHRVNPGDDLHVNFDPELKYDLKPRPGIAALDPYEVLYEDTHLLFVNKPAGLLTVPAESGKEPSLADAITDHYQRRGFKRFQLFIVHRIDRFTSGVLVFAKTPEALSALKKMFELHKLQRVYKAILVGELPENSGTLKGHVIEHAKTLRMRVVDPKKKTSEGAQSAVTHYRVLERLPGHTVVEVKLETGRRNQIRVQFADRGFPLLGDHVYGEVSPLLDRQALHAELLGLKHPVTEETLTVTAPLPKDMDAALRALRNRARVSRAAEGKKGEEGVFKPKESREHKSMRVARSLRFEPKAEGKGPRPGGYKPREEGGERPARGPRPGGYKPREEGGERPARGPRPGGYKPREEGGERPARGPRPGGYKPREEGGERPARSPRPGGYKPREEGGERPARGPRPGGYKPREEGGERPARSPRPGGYKPREEGGERPARGPRPGGFKPREEGGERPARGPRPGGYKPREEGGERPARGPRPGGYKPREEGGERPARGPRPGGFKPRGSAPARKGGPGGKKGPKR